MSREHLVEHGAEGENVRPVVGGLAAHLFGGHVTGGPQHHSRRRARASGRVHTGVGAGVGRLRDPGQTEVEDLGAAVGGEEDVPGRHVPMNDAFLVRGRQPIGHLNGEVDGGLLWQRAARERVAQRLAFEQLRHDERQPAFDADVEDRDNVGVIERGGGLRFPLEAGETVRVQRELGRQHFDRDVAGEPSVARPVDLAHAAGAQRCDDVIGTESRACDQRQGGIIYGRLLRLIASGGS